MCSKDSEKKLKICHVITRMIVGGAQENTLLSCRGALEAGHDVTLVTGPSPGPEGELLKRVSCPGLKIVECPWLVREIAPLSDLKAFSHLKKLFRTERYDVVHTHSSKAGIVGRFAARAAGVPLVVHTIHGLAFHRYEKFWKNLLYIACERAAAPCGKRIYAVAQAMIDQSLAAGVGSPDQYKVVYSGMELDRFLHAKPDPELRKKLGIPEDAVVLATLARLFPLKGYEQFLPVAVKLVKELPQIHCLIIGNGTMMEEIREFIRKEGVESRFSFAGLVAPGEVGNYLALASVLVHFSLREGLPRAAVQALAAGKPVIAYALDGTPEVVIPGKTGYLLKPGDRAGAEAAIRELVANPALAAELGANGRKLVESRFGWKTMSDTLLKDYAECLAAKKN